MQNQQEFLAAARKYFETDWRGLVYAKRFQATNLAHLVATEMAKHSLPTVTAAHLTFERMVRAGQIVRTDGKDERDDAKEMVDIAQKKLDATIAKVSAVPLSRAEVEYFASLSQLELSKLYWGPANDGFTDFAARYQKAMAEHGFRGPACFTRER